MTPDYSAARAAAESEGPTKGAYGGSIFVVSANGQVITDRQPYSAWFKSHAAFTRLEADPGDPIFVPAAIYGRTRLRLSGDWTQTLYQYGLRRASIASAVK